MSTIGGGGGKGGIVDVAGAQYASYWQCGGEGCWDGVMSCCCCCCCDGLSGWLAMVDAHGVGGGGCTGGGGGGIKMGGGGGATTGGGPGGGPGSDPGGCGGPGGAPAIISEGGVGIGGNLTADGDCGVARR